MKKVLIITYYWPPSGGAGVQRWLKFTKYLPEFGIEPIVLTVDPQLASYAQVDKSLEKEVSNSLQVYRTKTFEVYNLYKRISGKKEIPYGGFSNDNNKSIGQNLAKAIRGNFFIPDPRKGWNKYAIKKATQLIKEQNIETVITTSPPHSTQLIGLKLKEKLGIKWIADLRDPWTDIYYYKDLFHSKLATKIDQSLELKVLQNADNIITVSKDLKRLFSEKLDSKAESKILVIPNGFDEEDFEQSVKENTNKFIITYTGTISESYNINGFLEALLQLNQLQQQQILLRFVGNIPASIVAKIRNKLPFVELDLVGYVDHKPSIQYLLQSSMQLLIIPNIQNNKGIITGKFFEYLASKKPILAIGPKGGDLEELIDETKCGHLYTHNDSYGISSMIDQLMNNSFHKSQSTISKYSRKELTRALVSELGEMGNQRK